MYITLKNRDNAPMKNRYNFTIEKSIFEDFRKHCKEHCINMSAKVEQFIKKELEGEHGIKPR